MSDLLDILDVERPGSPDPILETRKPNQKKKKILEATFKRPEGMHRELYALLYSDNKDTPPLFPTDTYQGYKQNKANFGPRKVRPWKWMPFTNAARKDGLVLHHWRRTEDEGKEYPFEKFNKVVQLPTFTDSEYIQHLQCDSWTREETDYLFELCSRFDLRFIVIQDRWDSERYSKRTVEDLKERYYSICNLLIKARSPPGQEPKLRVYDGDHEKRRKEQLNKLYNRTPEEMEEEQVLINELRKIELRKKEREKKTQDLQKLITAADNSSETRRPEKKGPKKKVPSAKNTKSDNVNVETAGIKFPDFKASGVSLRSQRMKLPASVGQKKIKAIEQLMLQLSLDLNPFPCEEICPMFNEIRSDMVLVYELKLALASCEFDLQALSHQYEGMTGKSLDTSDLASQSMGSSSAGGSETESPIQHSSFSEYIDVGGSPGATNTKRKAAIEQSNILKQILSA